MPAWHRRDRFAAEAKYMVGLCGEKKIRSLQHIEKTSFSGSTCLQIYNPSYPQGPFKIASTFTLPKSTLLLATENLPQRGI